jgi:hypothetical protein
MRRKRTEATVKAVAVASGVTAGSFYIWIRRRWIRARRSGGQWRIPVDGFGLPYRTRRGLEYIGRAGRRRAVPGGNGPGFGLAP